MENNELKHHGIIGMKWGVRRYQNKDGTLTAAGKKRASRLESQYNDLTGKKLAKSSKNTSESQGTKKKLSDMTDDELKSRINRLQSEKTYLDLDKQVKALQPEQISRGKKFFKRLSNDVIVPAAVESGKRLLADFINKKGREALGLNGNVTDPMKDLEKEVNSLNLKKQKNELNKYFEREREKESKTKQTSDFKQSSKQENKKSNKQENNSQSTSNDRNQKNYDSVSIDLDKIFSNISKQNNVSLPDSNQNVLSLPDPTDKKKKK